MKRPPSSIQTQITAAERAHGRLDGSSPPLPSEGLIALEQGYLADAVRTLEWVATHADDLRAFLASRKAEK